ncbi:hypothetical protein BRADI_5g09783v3 [Brachypodium distachyon]|uniref:Uncharacterized protein n=1 Tax=Brachypodium distachyon TaxID=15368 RepID=A0A2K2CGA3_BRADI|nr:hypothetical protein BRADI_5g09783v3 [Brachypodium distachyon]PNT61059.1 hypothetical protein BRADI_5g09783v3 [Brachypodium distachyon]
METWSESRRSPKPKALANQQPSQFPSFVRSQAGARTKQCPGLVAWRCSIELVMGPKGPSSRVELDGVPVQLCWNSAEGSFGATRLVEMNNNRTVHCY